jgi:hypothetical protein
MGRAMYISPLHTDRKEMGFGGGKDVVSNLLPKDGE